MLSSSSSTTERSCCHRFSLDEINDAENLFENSKILGKGGEGKVYLSRVYIDGKETTVAVKHLKSNHDKGFQKEIQTVSRIQHPNLVALLGYCEESDHKILVYEYMENGSLANYVNKNGNGNGNSTTTTLSWQQRVSVCLGAARGLKHLHAETNEYPHGIIHRDVKPENILVDENWVGKVSDFGLFKLSHAGQEKSSVFTTLKGTSGYYAPEYVKYRSISRKIDVYAFGVVLFQVLCQKLPWDRGNESYYGSDDEDLGLWARQNVDCKIEWEICNDALMTFTDIIRRSLQANPTRRPTMDSVVLDLEKVLNYMDFEYEDEAKLKGTAYDPYFLTELTLAGSGNLVNAPLLMSCHPLQMWGKQTNQPELMSRFRSQGPLRDHWKSRNSTVTPSCRRKSLICSILETY